VIRAGLYELDPATCIIAQIRPVQVEDVLGRGAVEVDLREIGSYLAGHTVLVTGAGGSIGAEALPSDRADGPDKAHSRRQRWRRRLFEIERELVSERDFTAAIPKLVDVKNRTAAPARGLREVPADDRLSCGAYKTRHLDGGHIRSSRCGTTSSQRSRGAVGPRTSRLIASC